MKTLKLLAVLVCFAALAIASSHENEYKTGTLISWGAGGENCAGISVGRSLSVGTVNCNPGGDTLYKIASEGHQYTLTRGDDQEGMIHSVSDPLRQLLPNAEFKFRIDKKHKFFFVLWSKDNGRPKETKYTIRGLQ